MSQAHHSDDDGARDLVRAWLAALRCALPRIAEDAVAAVAIGVALWLVTVVGPRVEEAGAKAQASVAQYMADLDRGYCEKWGIVPGSRAFIQCTEDLSRLRSRDLTCRAPNPVSM